MFPFQFVDRLGKHDMVCSVSESGRSAQAGAIRLATANALCSFLTEDEVERMRQGTNVNRKGNLIVVIAYFLKQWYSVY